MQPEERDKAYLWDMLDAAKAIRSFTDAISYEQYLRDRKVQMAVERAPEIIGEAARKVSDKTKAGQPAIPWKSIIAQRNVLAHEYGEIKQDRLWAVVKNHIPALIDDLEKIIPPTNP
jgi:uncharacterized protein with HEPN domain